MRPATRRPLWLAALLIAAAVFYFQSAPSGDKPETKKAASAPAGDAAADESVAPRPVDTLGQQPRAALPPPDAPLAAILDPLAVRADAGDPWAACRLAMELLRCQQVAYFAGIPGFNDRSSEKEMEAKGDFDTADKIARSEMETALRRRECQAVPDTLRERGGHYLRQAARAGEPEAMLRYADGMGWPMDGRGAFSDPGFDTWRREAPDMLRRAFEAGVPEAPYLYWTGHQMDVGVLSALVPDDPVRAEAMRMLMMRLHGWNERLVPSTLDAASLARAREMAGQWHEGPFKGRSYAGQERSLFQFPGHPRQDGKPLEFCTGDRLIP